MTKIVNASLAAMLVALLPAAPAQALNLTSFVAFAGSGSVCTRASPCNNFGVAALATQVGGRITCLDEGPFFGGTITQSITIDCEATGGNINSDFTALTVNGPGIIVSLRNLTFTGFDGSAANRLVGVSFINGKALHIENVYVSGYQNGTSVGVKFAPSAPGSQLFMKDTVVSNNGSGFTGGGIVIAPASGVTAQVALNRVTVTNNSHGIVADGTGGGAIRGVVSDSVVSGNANNGITVSTSGAGAAVLLIQNTKVSGNNYGLVAGGGNAGMLVGQSNISLNNTGLFTAGGGVLLSYKNNSVNGNTTADGTFTGPVGQQ
jgi:hypothetical protein